MGKHEFTNELKKHGIAFSAYEPMSRHTTFKIGGNADVFVLPKSEEELIFCIKTAGKCSVPFCIIGNGSNILASDDGVEGAVICLLNMKGIKISGDTAVVLAGQSLMSFCMTLQRKGLSGLEFAYGIPGTVGGAVYMNAGAYGGEIKDAVVSVRYLDKSGKICVMDKEQMNLRYRSSIFQENGGIILSAEFRLNKDDSDKILERMNEYLSRRKEKQPVDLPSAGSTFRRPEGNYAGTLIEKSGLKGKKTGGAQVSEKHAGFIVNTGGAKSRDVVSLIEKIQAKVLNDSGVKLQTEVIFLGR